MYPAGGGVLPPFGTNDSDLRFEVIVNFVIEVHVCGACVHVCHN
jgi:hypothetical protein